ncbi:hypothetical protein [Streptomyces erythrochromogenes]|uniref:hypothetical protein n=1 Tax=Streptomyces erythrochromogenes TaxID=285574 RepID=UPI00369ED43F
MTTQVPPPGYVYQHPSPPPEGDGAARAFARSCLGAAAAVLLILLWAIYGGRGS